MYITIGYVFLFFTAMETDDMYTESEQKELEENVSKDNIFHTLVR